MQALEIEPAFYTTFGAYFDNDVLDSWEWESLSSEAEACAAALKHDVQNLPRLVEALTRAVDTWPAQFAEQLSKASNTDWTADEESEKDLQRLVKKLLYELK